MFLLHGTPGSRLGVRPNERDLRRLRVCLITYDRPGYGLSDPKHGRTVADAAADVELIADYYGYDRFVLLGRSGGGPHALACAALLPSRVGAVASLLGLAPYDAEGLDWFDGMNDANHDEYHAALAGRSVLAGRLFPEVMAIRANPGHLVDRLVTEAPSADQELLRDPDYRKLLIENFAEAVEDCLDGWVSDNLAFIRPWRFDPAWIRTPTLLWHGRDDMYSPVGHARWLAERIPGAELRLADGVGHFDVMVAQLKAIEWLLDHDGHAGDPPRYEATPVNSSRLW